MTEPTWTTKDGRELKLSEIGDNHLLNIYKLLLRRSNDIADLESFASSPFAPQGEMACDDLDRALYQGCEASIQIDHALEVIGGEIKKRKMAIPEIPREDTWSELTGRIESIKPIGGGKGTIIKLKGKETKP